MVMKAQNVEVDGFVVSLKKGRKTNLAKSDSWLYFVTDVSSQKEK